MQSPMKSENNEHDVGNHSRPHTASRYLITNMAIGSYVPHKDETWKRKSSIVLEMNYFFLWEALMYWLA